MKPLFSHVRRPHFFSPIMMAPPGMSIQLDGSGPIDMQMDQPSFTLSQSGTFVKEDFVINRQGIAAVGGTEVARVVGLRLQDLQLLEVLGKGASSLVRRAVHTPSQTELAVKVINVFDKDKRDQLLRELRTLYSSAFPWLVSFHDCLYDEGAMYIVLEYMDGGSLADVLIATQLTGSGAPSELVLGRIAAKTLAGLNYLHRERHQVHRDIKPGNILLNSRGEIKISDFGLSAELDSTKEMCATFIGTHAYMSPERLGGKPYSFASDIWSLGITLIECAIGQFPYTAYNGNNYFVLLSQILNDPPPSLPDAFSPEFRDLVLQCLTKDAEQRPSAEDLLKHPFIAMHDESLSPLDMAEWVKICTQMRKDAEIMPPS